MGRAKKLTKEQTVQAIQRPDMKPIPVAPSTLSPIGVSEWNRMSELLAKAGLLDPLDYKTLETYCMVVENLHEAHELYRADGMFHTTPNGYPTFSNAWNAFNVCVKQVNTFYREFGLSPAARKKHMGEAMTHVDNKVLTFLKTNGTPQK